MKLNITVPRILEFPFLCQNSLPARKIKVFIENILPPLDDAVLDSSTLHSYTPATLLGGRNLGVAVVKT
jgi:hypothetical protein